MGLLIAYVAILILLAIPVIILVYVKKKHHAPYFAIKSKKDILLGSTLRYFSFPLVQSRLNTHEQKYHASIFGRSGSGKSKLLQGMFLQHVRLRNGVGILEPHHDLSYDCLTSLVSQGFYKDPQAYDKVIYIDWTKGYIPFNILKSPAEHHTIAANVLDAFHRVWPALGEGSAPAFDNIVKQSIRVLLANDLPLTKLVHLITSEEYRNKLLEKVTDPDILQYWKEFFDRMPEVNKQNEIASTHRRLSLLTDNPLLKLTLGQPGNALNFREIMDQGKAIIINLGNVGDLDTRKLIGALIMIQIEQAALSRTSLLPHERTPFTLMVDEWPAFAAQQDTISHILSQCRKFNLRLYLAAQSLAQVDSKRLSGALENCKLQIAFGLGRDSAEAQAKHIGIIEPHLVKEEAMSHSQHNMYTALNEQWELWTQELQQLKSRWAYVKLEGVHAMKIRTLSVPTPKIHSAQVSEVLANYQRKYQKTEEEALALMVTDKPTVPAYAQLFD